MAENDYTTYCIYRIVCFQTGKVYVGRTNDPKTRKRYHFKKLEQGIHINDRIQREYDKHGKDAFYFEVIQSDISSSDIDQIEINWIAHFDSFQNGYNRTSGGTSPNTLGKSCIWNGIQFSSISEAARSCGITVGSMFSRFEKGYTCDSDMMGSRKNSPKRPCIWNGIAYSSISEAARMNALKPATLYRRLRVGQSSDDDVFDRKKPCVWNGIHYVSIAEAAQANSISERAMNRRVKMGYLCDDDLKRKPKNDTKR